MAHSIPPRIAHPEVNALLDELAASGRPSSRTLPLPDGRRNFAELIEPVTSYPEVAAAEDRSVEVGGRDVPVRVYRPDGPARAGAAVFLHGGGWVFGDLRSHDGMCRAITRQSRVTMVAVDYRRAPEDPFPAAVEDAVGVIRWLAGHGGEIGVPPGPLAVVGDSSGGNLAAAAALVLRDDGGTSPLSFQALLYPATDPGMGTVSYQENADDPFLSRDEMTWYWSSYGGGKAPDDPRAALSAVTDLSGLPPSYVLVAGLDPLRDEGLAFAAALRRSGVPVRCREYSDMPHGFLLFAGRLSRAREGLAEVAGQVAAGLAAQA
jgi:acetyl esterase